MTNIELQIKNIVYEELSKLISTIEGDFKTNFVKKRYNFLLSQLDENITANMVFVSSFESKFGNGLIEMFGTINKASQTHVSA